MIPFQAKVAYCTSVTHLSLVSFKNYSAKLEVRVEATSGCKIRLLSAFLETLPIDFYMYIQGNGDVLVNIDIASINQKKAVQWKSCVMKRSGKKNDLASRCSVVRFFPIENCKKKKFLTAT